MRRVSWHLIETGQYPARESLRKTPIDEFAVCFYYRFNTGKEVIKKYMSSNHSEVAET